MSDYYPAGVTGAERQIAGSLGEMMMHQACTNEALFVPTYLVSAMNADFADKAVSLFQAGVETPAQFVAQWAQRWTQQFEEQGRELECEWEGAVEVTIVERSTGAWTCPRCGEEHEVDLSDWGRDD